MIGLFGNIVEVPSLRPRLMTEEFVEEVTHLLDWAMENSELSYAATGVLAHLASDGAKAWTISKPKREDVLVKMSKAMNIWDLMSKRSINYRSLTPIISLARESQTVECQMWAVWTLASLTSVSPEMYCRLLLQARLYTLPLYTKGIFLIIIYLFFFFAKEIFVVFISICVLCFSNFEEKPFVKML